MDNSFARRIKRGCYAGSAFVPCPVFVSVHQHLIFARLGLLKNNFAFFGCRADQELCRQYVQSHIDETGWKNQAKRIYLCCFVGTLCVFFHIADSRGSKVLKKVLGPVFNGVIGRAEQSFRHAVMWRKICFGSQSKSGERYVARILSVMMLIFFSYSRLWQRMLVEFLHKK